MGGKFAWVRPDVYPLIGAVAVGCSMGVYIMTRKMLSDPSVELNRERRQYAVKPEHATHDAMATAYRGSALFDKLSKIRSPHMWGGEKELAK